MEESRFSLRHIVVEEKQVSLRSKTLPLVVQSTEGGEPRDAILVARERQEITHDVENIDTGMGKNVFHGGRGT